MLIEQQLVELDDLMAAELEHLNMFEEHVDNELQVLVMVLDNVVEQSIQEMKFERTEIE